jgi:serine/threonine-protein kinase
MDDELGVHEGQVLADKYRLVELLGRGGMGSVWRAEHLSLLSLVAVKVLKPSVASNANSRARFLREAKAAAMLRSPHVVQILDHGSDGEAAYIVMEMLDGETLHRRLARDGKLAPALTLNVMTQIGRAIAKAHQAGIVHRDLKPDNIFLSPNEEELLVKVLDFGIVKASVPELNTTGSPETQTGALLGTPYYMSPEQVVASNQVDHRADLWPIGVMTFECLLGVRPYQGASLGDLVLQICSRPQPVPSELGPVPPGFDAWFARSQQRDPEERFQSAREMIRELGAILRGPEGRAAPGEASWPDAKTTGSGLSALAAARADGEAAPATGVEALSGSRTEPMPPPAPLPGATSPAATSPSLTLEDETSHADTVLDSSSATPAPTPPGGKDAPAPLLETLDPLSSTAQGAGRRRIMVGAVAVGLGAVLAIAWALREGEPPAPGTAGPDPAARGSSSGSFSGASSGASSGAATPMAPPASGASAGVTPPSASAPPSAAASSAPSPRLPAASATPPGTLDRAPRKPAIETPPDRPKVDDRDRRLGF